MSDQQPKANNLDDALAWCLTQKESGSTGAEQSAIETFPQYADELRAFFATERQLAGRVKGLGEQADALVPAQIAQYELRGKLGAGSFGVVHRAWDTQLHRFVAIKTPRHFIGGNKSHERFLREALTASQLNHPHIVRTIEIGKFESTPFIVSEIIDGDSLRDRMLPLAPPRWTAQFACDLAAGLEHAHERQVIHRDLTPKNILVDSDDCPHILDFGLAKFLHNESTVTMVGDVLGTPAYVAPEQVSGKGHEVDGRADIYALGVILFEMLTSNRPFDGAPELLLHRIQFEEPADPCELNPDVPRRLANICCKCLEKAPHDRYQSATDLIADLRLCLDADESTETVAAVNRSKHTPVGKATLAVAGICSFALVLLLLPKNSKPEHSDEQSTLSNTSDSPARLDDAEGTTPIPRPRILRGHPKTVASADFRSDGQRLVTCGHDALVCVWDWKTGDSIWTNDSHKADIWSVDWSPDGKLIATASWDQVSKILDAESGEVLRDLRGHTGRVCCVQFSPDGQTIATAACDGSIRFWDPSTGVQTNELRIEGADFTNCQFMPGGESLLATDWKGRLAKWNLSNNELQLNKIAHKNAAWTVCYVPHMSAIATGGEDGFVRLWDETTGALLVEQKAATAHVTCVRPHPNGRQLMHSSHDKSICIWDPDFEKIEKQFLGHEHWIYEFVLHPDEPFFVSTSVDQTVRIWGINEGLAN